MSGGRKGLGFGIYIEIDFDFCDDARTQTDMESFQMCLTYYRKPLSHR